MSGVDAQLESASEVSMPYRTLPLSDYRRTPVSFLVVRKGAERWVCRMNGVSIVAIVMSMIAAIAVPISIVAITAHQNVLNAVKAHARRSVVTHYGVSDMQLYRALKIKVPTGAVADAIKQRFRTGTNMTEL